MTATPARAPVRLEDSYARAVPRLSVAWQASDAPAPRLLVLQEELAAQLGFDPAWLRSEEGVAFLLGRVPGGVPPVAQVYAGHQFGNYVPQLGDGRALLVGEVIDAGGVRRDLHLKGSGPTPFARRGDGKAVVGPMLREYLVSEAMHALGVPSTRSLSVVATGEQVFRERPMPGAVLCRVAASHLRVGTFQYAAALGEPQVLRSLADYAIERHYPHAADAENPYLSLYESVVAAQAELIAGWMAVGFIHGVMNTDNMAISGQTIDYGPCAFMDAYDPSTVFSSIDHAGRYAYGNQPGIAQWNLARFGETLLPLLDDRTEAAVEAATAVLLTFPDRYEQAAARVFSAKLGLPAPDPALVGVLTVLLEEGRVDFTTFFRALAGGAARELFTAPEAFDAWAARRDAALPADAGERAALAAAMNRINPLYIPRNDRVEEALDAANEGDLGPFERLLEAVRHPFDERAEWADLAGPAPAGGPPHITYCGT